MNIQIFGTKKCSDTRKAERFFKERGIKYQFIDMKDQDTLALIRYLAPEDKLEKILGNPQVIKTPVVRNGKQSTLGYQPEVWKGWS